MRASIATPGVTIKSGSALETLARATTVVLDKTGTLTEGRLSVTAQHHYCTPPAIEMWYPDFDASVYSDAASGYSDADDGEQPLATDAMPPRAHQPPPSVGGGAAPGVTISATSALVCVAAVERASRYASFAFLPAFSRLSTFCMVTGCLGRPYSFALCWIEDSPICVPVVHSWKVVSHRIRYQM